MKIAVANISKNIASNVFVSTVRAVAYQVKTHFAPLWDMDAHVAAATHVKRDDKPDPELADADVVLYVGELEDDPQKVADALGYHDMNQKGIPYGFVFTDVAAKVGEEWSTTLSHEVLELVADPDVNLLVVGPHPTKKNSVVLRSYEVCDPVQADTYMINGTPVSNFVTPLYFANLPSATATRTNYMSRPLDRFGVRPGGYFSYFDLATQKWSDVFGDNAAKERAAAKSGTGTMRRMGRHAGLGLGK